MTCPSSERVRRLLLALLLAVAAGCTITREYDGEGLTAEQLERLERAETKAQVLEQVGPPTDVGLQLDGSVFIYRFRREEAENLNLSFFNASFDYQQTDRRTDRLVVLFDKQGRKTGCGLDQGTRERE